MLASCPADTPRRRCSTWPAGTDTPREARAARPSPSISHTEATRGAAAFSTTDRSCSFSTNTATASLSASIHVTCATEEVS